MADIGISIGLSGVQKYQQDLTQLQSGTQRFAGNTERSVGRLKSSFQELGNEVPILGRAIRVLSNPIAAATVGLIGLGSALTSTVRSAAEFETTSIQFETLIGDAEIAKQALQNLSDFAAGTPFQFKDIASAGRSLLAFGTEAGDLESTLRRLGDISAGVNAPLGEIAEIYGKIQVQGRLFAEDVNQLTGRGIPVIQELAKQFGVADSEVKKLVESGQVGFPEIEKAFISLTGEGGKFAGLTENLAGSFSGQLSTLKDSFAIIGRDIGTIFLPAATLAVSTIQSVISVLGDIPGLLSDNSAFLGIATGALIAYNAATIQAALKGIPALVSSISAQVVALRTQILNTNLSIGATAAYITVTNLLTGRIGLATAAMRLLNITMLSNPIVAVGAAIVAASAAWLIFRDRTDDASRSAKLLVEATENLNQKLGKEKAQIEALFRPLRNNTSSKEEQKRAINAVNDAYGSYLPNLLSEESSVEDIAKAYDLVTSAILRKVIAQTREQEIVDIYERQINKTRELNKELERLNKARDVKPTQLVAPTVFVPNTVAGVNERRIPAIQEELNNLKDQAEADIEAISSEFAKLEETFLGGLAPTPVVEAEVKVKTGSASSAKEIEESLTQLAAKFGISIPATIEFDNLNEIGAASEAIAEAEKRIINFGLTGSESLRELKAEINGIGQVLERLPVGSESAAILIEFQSNLQELVDEEEQRLEDLRNRVETNPIVIPVEFGEIPSIPVPELEIKADLQLPSSVLDQINSLSALAKNAGVSVEFLERNFRDVNDAMGVFNNIGSRVIQTLGGSNEAAFMAGIEFERLSQQIGDVAVRSLTTFGETFGRELAIGIQDSVDFGATTERVFTGVASNLYAMATGSQTFGQTVANTFGIAKEEIFGLGSVASVVTNSLVKAFISAVDVLLSEVPKLVGVFLLKEAIVSAAVPPVAIPLAISGLALIGFSGFASELLKKVIGADELETPEFEAPEIGTGFSSGGASSTRLESGALTESSLNVFEQTQTSRTTEVNVIFDGQNVNAAFAQFFQVNEQLTG